MAKQSNPGLSNQSTPAAREIASVNNDQSDSMGQAILRLLHAAADETETDSRRSLGAAQRLSHQLLRWPGRIASSCAALARFP